jgi:capsid protein
MADPGTAAARRARDAVRNDPYAARIVDLWTGNAVGAGITTRWPDTLHAEAWRRWSDSTACDAEGRLDRYGLQALVMRAVVDPPLRPVRNPDDPRREARAGRLRAARR